MRERELQERIDAQLARQQDYDTGATLREEAIARLQNDHVDLPKEQYDSWLQLLKQEEYEIIPNVSAGAAALVMMDIRDSRKQGNAHNELR